MITSHQIKTAFSLPRQLKASELSNQAALGSCSRPQVGAGGPRVLGCSLPAQLTKKVSWHFLAPFSPSSPAQRVLVKLLLIAPALE